VQVADGVHVAVASADAMALEPVGLVPSLCCPRPTPRTRQFAAVRTLLRDLLIEVAGRRVGSTPIAAHANSQPYLPERPDLSVSLSHSGDWVAAAVGTGAEVGVDVQVPEPTSDALLRRCCTPTARDLLRRMSGSERDREFAWIWSAQEACVKAVGMGLAGRPWTIPVNVGQRTGAWNEVRWQSLREEYAVPVTCAYRPLRAPQETR
jgi:4'-phosphopantetheinyl transferase